MPHDALYGENAAAHQHPNVPCGSEQHHGTDEKVLSSGNAVF
jgi:hypothetical protein